MGSFNHKCNFSQLPTVSGDRIVVMVGVRMTNNVLEADGFSPGNSFTPVSVPIRGEYNDYGVNEYSVSLANTSYGGADLMASKHDNGTISYCIAVDADGIDYSDNMLYCPFCGKKLKRRWK